MSIFPEIRTFRDLEPALGGHLAEQGGSGWKYHTTSEVD